MKESYLIVPFLLLCIPLIIVQIKGEDYWKKEPFRYSQRSAKLDITNDKIKVVTFDKNLYHLNQKYKYTQSLGFEYIYEPYRNERLDEILIPLVEEGETSIYDMPIPQITHNDFGYNREDILLAYHYFIPYSEYSFSPNDDFSIGQYNQVIMQFLTEQDSLWLKKLNYIEDSLRYLKVDQFGKKTSFNLGKLPIPKQYRLPTKMKEALRLKKDDISEYEFLTISKNRVLKHDVHFILNQLDTNSTYQSIIDAEVWSVFNYEKIMLGLIKRLVNKTEVGLTNSADLIHIERIQSRDLTFYGHGTIIYDDPFTIAGRANYLLCAITGQDFGRVSMYVTNHDLKKLQNRWIYWLLHIDKYQSPKRMDIIQSEIYNHGY